jgi:hypothetical protein
MASSLQGWPFRSRSTRLRMPTPVQPHVAHAPEQLANLPAADQDFIIGLGVRLALPGDGRGPIANDTLSPKVAARDRGRGRGKWWIGWSHSAPSFRGGSGRIGAQRDSKKFELGGGVSLNLYKCRYSIELCSTRFPGYPCDIAHIPARWSVA